MQDHAAHKGGCYVSPPLPGAAVCAALSRLGRGEVTVSPLDRPWNHERALVERWSSKKIAELLHLAPTTVATYRSRGKDKLGVGDLSSLVELALTHGLRPPARRVVTPAFLSLGGKSRDASVFPKGRVARMPA